MKTSITKFSQGLTAILLGALGFSACSDLENDQPDMYGTPTMDFQTKGCVTDTENNPIQGLRVELTEHYHDDGDYKVTTQTPLPMPRVSLFLKRFLSQLTISALSQLPI